MKNIKNKLQLSAEEFNKHFELKPKDNKFNFITTESGELILDNGYKVTFEKDNGNLYQLEEILSVEQKEEIKLLRAEGISLRKLGKRFKVSHSTIYRALKGVKK